MEYNFTLTNINILNKLLDQLEWEDILIKRHLKFIYAYEKHNRSITLTAEQFNLEDYELLSIFWRIQKHLQKHYNENKRIILFCEKHFTNVTQCDIINI